MEVTDIQVKVGLITLGKDTKVEATTSPSGQSVTFQSSDNSIATILPDESNINGCKCINTCYIHPISKGTFKLIVTSGGCKVYLEEKVIDDDSTSNGVGIIDGLKLDTDNIVIKVGDTHALHAITENRVDWTSNNDEIASVNDGIVTANKVGTCLIKATSGEYYGYCKVEVIGIGSNKDKYTIAVGERISIPINIDKTNLQIYWNSTKSGIVDIIDNIVIGKSLGETIVSATALTATGPITTSFIVEVIPNFVPITDLSNLNINDIELYNSDDELRLANTNVTIKVLPETLFVPRLYYVRIDNDPFKFNYKICAIHNDIDKYLLKLTNREK